MKKGFIGGFAGAFTAIILVIMILAGLIYVFGPYFMPSSPCLVDSNCEPQRICCRWRCDSMEIDWWNCPDALCSFLDGGIEAEDLNCGCDDLRCKHIEPGTEEEKVTVVDKLFGNGGEKE